MGPQRRSLHTEIVRAPFSDGPIARPSDECEEETCASLVSHGGSAPWASDSGSVMTMVGKVS